MSDTAENKIKNSLVKAARAMRDEGLNPSKAVAKAASEDRLSPDMTRRVIEALNIHLSNEHLKTATDKASHFPQAIPEEVLADVFAPLGKEPEYLKAASPDSEWGSGDDAGALRLVMSEVGETKVAAETFAPGPQVLSEDYDIDAQFRRVSAGVDGWQKRARALNAEADELLEKAQGVFCSLAGIVKAASEKDATRFFQEAQQEALAHDDVLIALSVASGRGDTLPAPAPHTLFFSKTASHDALENITTLLSRCAHKVDEAFVAHVEADNLQSALDAFTSNIKEAAGYGERDPLSLNHPEDHGHAIRLGKVAEMSFFEDPVGKALEQGYVGSVAANYAEADKKHLENQFKTNNSKDDDEADNLRRVAIITDLMKADPILSKQDPHLVIRHYNNLISVAPDVSMSPEIARSFLRTSVAAEGIDPHSANQISELQGSMMKNKGTMPASSDKGKKK